MSLFEEMEQLKKQIESAELAEAEEVEEVEESAEESPAEEEAQDPVEAVEEEKKESVVEEKKEETDSAGAARLRREAAAERKKNEALQREIDELRASQKAAVKDEVEEIASRQETPPEIASLVEEQRIRGAEREFAALEEKFQRTAPDYESVSQQYALALAQSIKIQNPRMSNIEVAEQTKRTLLAKAGDYVRKGYDPIEELYHEAKELGFKAQEKKAEVAQEEELKPDLSKVAKNRAKSTGMAASSGRSEGKLTKAAAADLSVGEWAKLPKEEKRRLLSS